MSQSGARSKSGGRRMGADLRSKDSSEVDEPPGASSTKYSPESGLKARTAAGTHAPPFAAREVVGRRTCSATPSRHAGWRARAWRSMSRQTRRSPRAARSREMVASTPGRLRVKARLRGS